MNEITSSQQAFHMRNPLTACLGGLTKVAACFASLASNVAQHAEEEGWQERPKGDLSLSLATRMTCLTSSRKVQAQHALL